MTILLTLAVALLTVALLRARRSERAAVRRLAAARDTMLAIAEEVARQPTRPTRPLVTYAPPVRALPRAHVSRPAPACPTCFAREVTGALFDGQRVLVATVLPPRQPGESPEAFAVRWGLA